MFHPLERTNDSKMDTSRRSSPQESGLAFRASANTSWRWSDLDYEGIFYSHHHYTIFRVRLPLGVQTLADRFWVPSGLIGSYPQKLCNELLVRYLIDCVDVAYHWAKVWSLETNELLFSVIAHTGSIFCPRTRNDCYRALGMLLSTQGLCISVGFLHHLYPFNSLRPSSYPQNTMLKMSPPPVIAVKPFASVPDKQGRIEVMTSGGDTWNYWCCADNH